MIEGFSAYKADGFSAGDDLGDRYGTADVKLAVVDRKDVDDVTNRDAALAIVIASGAPKRNERGVHFGAPESVLPVGCPEPLRVIRHNLDMLT